ncbi:hypothetical protein HUJ05_001552, partial [Dendroctonus ponderosae]
GPPQPGQPFKFTVAESCDRIKEEFNFLQAQYHSLKLDCEKLASEKIEIQRHYVMYYEMSYGLNVEMHKQVSQFKRFCYFFFNFKSDLGFFWGLRSNLFYMIVIKVLPSAFLRLFKFTRLQVRIFSSVDPIFPQE